MRALGSCLLVKALAPAAAGTADQPAEHTPAKAELEKLKKEHYAALIKFDAETRKEKAELKKVLDDKDGKDAEKKEAQKKLTALARKGPQQEYGFRYVEFAHKHPGDPSVFEALDLALRNSEGPFQKQQGARAQAITALQAHVTERGIERCFSTLTGTAVEDESVSKLLYDVMLKNPDRRLQAKACKALIRASELKVQLGSELKQNERFRKDMEELSSKESVAKYLASIAGAGKEGEALKKTLQTKYGDLDP
jgi:hypothetical protein